MEQASCLFKWFSDSVWEPMSYQFRLHRQDIEDTAYIIPMLTELISLLLCLAREKLEAEPGNE